MSNISSLSHEWHILPFRGSFLIFWKFFTLTVLCFFSTGVVHAFIWFICIPRLCSRKRLRPVWTSEAGYVCLSYRTLHLLKRFFFHPKINYPALCCSTPIRLLLVFEAQMNFRMEGSENKLHNNIFICASRINRSGSEWRVASMSNWWQNLNFGVNLYL